MGKYFMETVIVQSDSGFGSYQCLEYNGDQWEDKNDLLSEIQQNVYDFYELGCDELPEDVENILGSIENQPDLVYAYRTEKDGCVKFGGIKEFNN